MSRSRLVVGITGASGAVYGVRLLQRARALGLETHLVVTPAGVLNAHHELGLDRAALDALADGRAQALDATVVGDFMAAYEAHMARENDELLPMAARLLDDATLARIGQAMRERRGIPAP